MKHRALQIVVFSGLVVAALVFRGRDRSSETALEGEGPQTLQTTERADEADWSAASSTVTALLGAAGDGDDETYLNLLSGDLRRSMEETRSELGREAFRAELVRSAAGIKGLATKPAESAPDKMVALEVEIVFADRNERQRMVLAPGAGGWVIVDIQRAQMIEPVVPYGTPVFEEEGAATTE